MRVLIAGGGIGGLTAALACARAGHEVTVLERAAKPLAIGAGIQLSPNAMCVMRALGLEDQLKTRGFLPGAIETRMGQTGRTVFSISASKTWPAPYIHIHRAAFMDVLITALNEASPKALKFGREVLSYEQGETDITLPCKDGAVIKADILIGADGIHSAVRAQMLGPDAPDFTGNVAWRAVVPAGRIKGELPPPTACAWMGPNRHAVTYHLGEGLINFVGVVEQPDWQIESWTEPGDKVRLAEDFAGWHPIIRSVIDAIDGDALFRWALFDRAPLCHWTDKRVALLGDSAHPMLPFMAQGAAMAIEDAYILAREISKKVPVSEALSAYQSARYSRTSRVQYASRQNMEIFHRRTAVSKLATYGPMWLAGKLAPAIIRKRLGWIYGEDVTARK